VRAGIGEGRHRVQRGRVSSGGEDAAADLAVVDFGRRAGDREERVGNFRVGGGRSGRRRVQKLQESAVIGRESGKGKRRETGGLRPPEGEAPDCDASCLRRSRCRPKKRFLCG
jgi:hypothetical protein